MKQIFLSGLAGAAIGAAVIWYGFPRHDVQIKTEQKTVTQYKVKTVEKIVERPDGTRTTERTTVDNTRASTNSSTSAVVSKKHDWYLGLTAGSKLEQFDATYGVRLERRIIGPVFAGAYATTNNEIGLSVGLEF